MSFPCFPFILWHVKPAIFVWELAALLILWKQITIMKNTLSNSNMSIIKYVGVHCATYVKFIGTNGSDVCTSIPIS